MKLIINVRIFAKDIIRNHFRKEMNSKLTLKLNKRTIERAKKYSELKKKSLSAIVENYFNLIVANDTVNDIEISPNVLELSGVINLSDKFELKQIYGAHLEEKYLN